MDPVDKQPQSPLILPGTSRLFGASDPPSGARYESEGSLARDASHAPAASQAPAISQASASLTHPCAPDSPPLAADESLSDLAFGISRGWMSALPDFALAGTFLFAWIAPQPVRPGLVQHLMLVMLLEFIIIHSSAFLGSVVCSKATRSGKVTAMLGLGGFYTIFVAAFSFGFHTWWPFCTFWLLMLNRLLGVMIGQAPDGAQTAFLQRTWVSSVLFYMLGCFATIFLPLPRFGITPGVVASLHLPGSGLWVSQPHRVLAFGFVYFAAVAWSEIGGHAWLKGMKTPTGTT